MHRRFRGLKMEDRGGLTYHSATSFVHLPASDRNTGGNKFLPLTDVNFKRRERLVNNAWQQRALENLSDIPVRASLGLQAGLLTNMSNPYRSRSNTC
jgi:hypothetical protein